MNLKSATTAASAFGTTFNPGTFGSFGIRFGHAKIFGSEHTFEYAPNFLDADTKAILYYSDFLLQAPLPKVKPYGSVGMGTVFTWGTDALGRPSLGKIGNRFAINYGGGVKIFPAGPVGIRFDLRGYVIPSVKFNLFAPTVLDPLATVKSQSENLNMLEAGVGVVFSFGGK